ncbi:MAG: hypothetical protein V7K95_14850 [Nostoc sp.]
MMHLVDLLRSWGRVGDGENRGAGAYSKFFLSTSSSPSSLTQYYH